MLGTESRYRFRGCLTRFHSVSTNPSYPSLALTTSPKKRTTIAGRKKNSRSSLVAFRTIPCLDRNPRFVTLQSPFQFMFKGVEVEVRSALRRASMTAMITQIAVTGNPPGVS